MAVSAMPSVNLASRARAHRNVEATCIRAVYMWPTCERMHNHTMNHAYLKFAVLRAAMREVWRVYSNPDDRRQAVIQYVKQMERGFVHSRQFTCAFHIRQLARECASTLSLIELVSRLREESEAVDRLS